MIKYFCDRCGKEIKGKAHEEINTTEAINYVTGDVVATWKTVEHICDECEQKDLTCGFKVGDEVITSDGRVGVIKSICDCERCKERGFFEPTIKMDDGATKYITISDKEDGFESYYQIGDRVFGNLDEESVAKELYECEKRQWQLLKQRSEIHKLKMIHQYKNKENSNGN